MYIQIMEAATYSCWGDNPTLLNMRVSYTTSTLPTGKQLTRNSTWRSCDVCVNQFPRKRPEKWRDGDWILHHDNAPAHTSHLVQWFFWPNTAPLSCSSRRTHQISHSVTFFLFPRLKKVQKGRRFETTEDIKRNSTKTQLGIQK